MVRKISQYRSLRPPSIDFSTNTYIHTYIRICSRRNTRREKKKKIGEKRREGEDWKKRRRNIDFSGREIISGFFVEDKYDNNCRQKIKEKLRNDERGEENKIF